MVRNQLPAQVIKRLLISTNDRLSSPYIARKRERERERERKREDRLPELRGTSWRRDRDEKGRKGPRPWPGPNSLQGVRCLGPLTRPLLSIPVIMHAVNKSAHRRKRNVRVLQGALRYRSHVRSPSRTVNGV